MNKTILVILIAVELLAACSLGNKSAPSALQDSILPEETGIETPTITPAIPGELTVSISSTMDPIENPSQVEAVNAIRTLFGLPDLPLKFVETMLMLDSPNMDLDVALYQDSEGRKYSVDPASNQVVEIDARDTLTLIPTDAPALSQGELRAKSQYDVQHIIPGFDQLKSGLSYEEGMKGDNYFFTWRSTSPNIYKNKPFIQVGLYKSGELFAYYNTVSLIPVSSSTLSPLPN